MDKNIKLRFEKLASEGTWTLGYGSLDSTTYNFISRRDVVKRLLKNNHFQTALDLGCGTGDYVTILSGCARQYVGVDFAPTMIKKAKDKYNSLVSFFTMCCAEKLPFKDNTFDLVIAIGFIEYFKNPNIMIQEIIRVLKPNGTIIMQSWQFSIYQRIRRILGFFNKIKYVDIPYTEDELDFLMQNWGFRKVACSFSNFVIFPKLIRELFPKVYITLSEMMSKKPHLFGVFAINYIGCYALIKR